MIWSRSGFADIDGAKLHYVRGGGAEPMLLSLGWPQTWREWDAVALALTAGYDVIAVDLPELGESASSSRGYAKCEIAGVIAALLDELGIEPAIVVGHDMGAATAFALSASIENAYRASSSSTCCYQVSASRGYWISPKGKACGISCSTSRPASPRYW